jgi:hypothetical protein
VTHDPTGRAANGICWPTPSGSCWTRKKADRQAVTRSHFIGASLALAVAAFAQSADAQVYGSTTHTVTVQVSPITVIGVDIAALTLQISSGTPGQETMTVTNAASSLLWGTNSSTQKITANTSNAAPLFDLRLVAVNPTGGSVTSEFSLSTTPHDLLLNVGRSLGSCTLRYTGVALASQAPGSDTHVITFTVQSQ